MRRVSVIAIAVLLAVGGTAPGTAMQSGGTDTPSETPTSTPTPREVRQLPASPTDESDNSTDTSTPTPTDAPSGTDNDIYVTNPDGDPDTDGLNNSVETRIGSDMHDWDTDGDGIEDGAEVKVPAADLLRRDVLIEVDRTNVTDWLADWERERIREMFDDAPIDNPDGSTGVNVHIVRSDVIPEQDAPFWTDDLINTSETYKDTPQAYKYVLLTEALPLTKVGLAYGDVVAVGPSRVPFFGPSTGGVFVHEIGHTLGLNSRHCPHVDTYTSDERYPSSMNYLDYDRYDYSSGGECNDWQYLQDEGFHHVAYHHDIPDDENESE